MPRGYLKHSQEVSKKKARGGSSGQNGNCTCARCKRSLITKSPDCQSLFGTDDFSLDVPNSATKSIVLKNSESYPIGECTICFNESPLICLSSKCRWHGAACRQCLHRIYVTNAQKCSPKNIVKSFPLACFHPLCDQPVTTAQLEKHRVFASPEEMKKHHEMLILSKIHKRKGMKTVRCPKCDMPRGVQKLGAKDQTYCCANCNTRYQVSPFYATFRALDNLKGDSIGINDGWARCPNCSILISKGDGCDFVNCLYCGHLFSWHMAQEKKDQVPHAKVPESEIHLWW